MIKRCIFASLMVGLMLLNANMAYADIRFDADGDKDIDGVDLAVFAISAPGPGEDFAAFASRFGTHVAHYEAFSVMPRYDKANLLEFGLQIDGLTPPMRVAYLEVLLNGHAVGLPAGISVDADSGTFSWSPTPSQTGLYELVIQTGDARPVTHTQVVAIDVLTPEICNSSGSACQFLKDQYLLGEAAGNMGDWYHNSDKFHSNINLNEFPQADLMFTDAYVGQYNVTPGRVIIGNSSTAFTSGPSWSSHTRYIMLNAYRCLGVYDQYVHNNHYWYPEHRDHDETDHFHGKIPFASASQGSSGSEVDEVKNFLYTLAAFRPDVKQRLVSEGLLMPTVQMLFRRVRVGSDMEYLSGTAHPSAFGNFDGRLAMVEMANAIEMDDIPPMVQIGVLEESFDWHDGRDEKLFDTPVSVGRIFRGHEHTKYLVVDAGDSYDINANPLTYHWVVLRGDPSDVRITYLNPEHSQARIEIDYHPQTTIGASTRLTNMVEVGVFVHNGVYYSAPAFITSFTLNNEERTYNPTGILMDIQYNTNYVHPYLLN